MADILNVLGDIGSKVDKRMLELLAVKAAKDFQPVVFHQVQAGGKRIRPALTITFCEAAGGKPEKALSAAAAIELVHNYSLILDDIIDDADFRRNLPTTWKKFGLSMGILAAIHYREAIEEGVLTSPNALQVARIIADTIRELTEGERLDVLFEQLPGNDEYINKHRYGDITLQDYETMIGLKTAALLRASCEVGVVCADGSNQLQQAANKFGWTAGIAFQMVDDVLDLFAEEKKLGKKLGKDIYEHKLGNAVILHALPLLSDVNREYVLQVLRSQSPTDNDVTKVIGILGDSGAKDLVQKRAAELIDDAKVLLKVFPNKKAITLLSNLVDFIYQRSY
jgi:geranylgeranyl diphosphate synthase type I